MLSLLCQFSHLTSWLPCWGNVWAEHCRLWWSQSHDGIKLHWSQIYKGQNGTFPSRISTLTNGQPSLSNSSNDVIKVATSMQVTQCSDRLHSFILLARPNSAGSDDQWHKLDDQAVTCGHVVKFACTENFVPQFRELKIAKRRLLYITVLISYPCSQLQRPQRPWQLMRPRRLQICLQRRARWAFEMSLIVSNLGNLSPRCLSGAEHYSHQFLEDSCEIPLIRENTMDTPCKASFPPNTSLNMNFQSRFP